MATFPLTDPRVVRQVLRAEANKLVERLNVGMEMIPTIAENTDDRCHAERHWVKLLRAYEFMEDRVKELTDEIDGPVANPPAGDADDNRIKESSISPDTA